MEKIIAQELKPSTVQEIIQLSNREMEVLELIAAGKTGKNIADKLEISLSTVKAHTKHIYRKLGVKRRVQAVIVAKEQHLIKIK